MRAERGGRVRTERRAAGRSAAVLVALGLAAGCGGAAPPAGGPGAATPVAAGSPAAAQQALRQPAEDLVASLPAALVGSWSGDDPQGVGSWTFEFSSDGHYAEYNLTRGFTVVGQALVSGRRLYLQPNDADSQTVTWAVDGGKLNLDGNVYLRRGGARQDGTALVGSWVGETDAWETLTFSGDGTWHLDGPSGTSTGRWSVAGDRLDTGRSTYTWSVDDARLQLDPPDGRTRTYSRIG